MKIRDVDTGALGWGLLFLAAGMAFLLDALGAWDLQARYVWPGLVIGLGLAVLFGAMSPHRRGGS